MALRVLLLFIHRHTLPRPNQENGIGGTFQYFADSLSTYQCNLSKGLCRYTFCSDIWEGSLLFHYTAMPLI